MKRAHVRLLVLVLMIASILIWHPAKPQPVQTGFRSSSSR